MEPYRVYVDGIFDLVHQGHIRLFEKAIKRGTELASGSRVELVVGVCSDGVDGYKRATIMTREERESAVRVHHLVFQLLADAPMSGPSKEFISKNRIDLVIHGDDFGEEKLQKYYGDAIEMGKFSSVPYESGVSTTEIIRELKKNKKFLVSTEYMHINKEDIILRVASRSWKELRMEP